MLFRKCPICDKPMKYFSIIQLEKSERYGVCCKECDVKSLSYLGRMRLKTDYDEKLIEGFNINIITEEIHYENEIYWHVARYSMNIKTLLTLILDRIELLENKKIRSEQNKFYDENIMF